MHLCVCAHECRYQKKTEEGIRSLETGVAGSFGLTDTSRGNQVKQQTLIPELDRQPMPAVMHRDSIA